MVGAANIVLDRSLKIHYYGNNSDTLRTLYGVLRLGLHQCLVRLWHKDRVAWGLGLCIALNVLSQRSGTNEYSRIRTEYEIFHHRWRGVYRK